LIEEQIRIHSGLQSPDAPPAEPEPEKKSKKKHEPEPHVETAADTTPLETA
jgi:hypothetical protein